MTERERYWPWRKDWDGHRCISCRKDERDRGRSFCSSCRKHSQERLKDYKADRKANPQPQDDG